MGVINIEARYPNGQRDAVVVEGERAMIGSASFADVRLPMDQAAYEHVVIELYGGTLRAEAKVDEPRATINGMPFTQSALAPDSVLGIGNVRLFVSFVPDAFDGPQANAKGKSDESSPAIRVIALVGFAVAVYMLLLDPDVPIAPPPATNLDLFGPAVTTCPQTAPEAALAQAQEKLDIAEGKRERLPFDVREGVAAVHLYEAAIACFRAGGHEPEAKDAEGARDSLRRSMVDDFRARRLRLEHMLAVKDYELAKKDVLVLQDMTLEKKGEYVDWLESVKRRLYPRKAAQ